MDFGELIKRDRDLDMKERWDKIRESKYNKWYSWRNS